MAITFSWSIFHENRHSDQRWKGSTCAHGQYLSATLNVLRKLTRFLALVLILHRILLHPNAHHLQTLHLVLGSNCSKPNFDHNPCAKTTRPHTCCYLWVP